MRILIFLAMLFWGGVVTAQTAQVTDAANVNMRSGKAENYRIIRVLPPGTEVQVIEVDQDYAKVKVAGGDAGWVLRKFLATPKAETKNAGQSQVELEAAQQALVSVRVELANLQREMEQKHNQPEGGVSTSIQLLISFGAFVCGVVIGVMALRAYYHKRLHGLRI